jgi:hypothetical protein
MDHSRRVKQMKFFTWETISSYADPRSAPNLHDCTEWINNAKALYNEIAMAPGMGLTGRSSDSHLEALADGVRLFAELSEIDV